MLVVVSGQQQKGVLEHRVLAFLWEKLGSKQILLSIWHNLHDMRTSILSKIYFQMYIPRYVNHHVAFMLLICRLCHATSSFVYMFDLVDIGIIFISLLNYLSLITNFVLNGWHQIIILFEGKCILIQTSIDWKKFLNNSIIKSSFFHNNSKNWQAQWQYLTSAGNKPHKLENPNKWKASLNISMRVYE